MDEGLTDRDEFLRRTESLALSARAIDKLPMVASPPTHHDGVMVALVPDSPEELALDHSEALPADDLHITLCYLGKVQDLSNDDKIRILDEARRVCDAHGYEFTATPDGVVVMGQNDEGVPATALLVQSDEVVTLYDAMSEALDYHSNFPSFIPHMTTGYGVPVELAQENVGKQVTFSNVLVKFGDDKHNIPLHSAVTAATPVDRVVETLGQPWGEALHPRDAKGKFVKKNGAVSGKLTVPAPGGGTQEVVANRAAVVGFRTIDNEVWVLAETELPDGTKVQGFAKTDDIRASAPVKARLDALYPVAEGEAMSASLMERQRQLDLILAHLNAEFDTDDAAVDFLSTMGLQERDLDYVFSGDVDDFGGIKQVHRPLSGDELDEVQDIIADAQHVKELRARVQGFREDTELGFLADDAHVPPPQRLLPV